ncbi:Futalosine hydrolase [Candidatus Magnetomoraceae bacterium gMMP-15]
MSSHILIAAAVHNELSKLFDLIDKAVRLNIGHREIISGYLNGKAVRLLITGPGIINTVQSLSAAIENSRPHFIIQTGCAGAFKDSGLGIGDIGIAAEEIDIHLGIEPENERNPLIELPFPVLKYHNLEIKNRYPFNIKLVNYAFKILKQNFFNKFKIIKGTFITVATITATDSRAKKLYEQFRPCMEAMEGVGTAHIGIHYEIPFLEIRSASNLVGKRDLSLWNLPLAFERSTQAVLTFISGLDEDFRRIL